jgi:hypothetical protein
MAPSGSTPNRTSPIPPDHNFRSSTLATVVDVDEVLELDEVVDVDDVSGARVEAVVVVVTDVGRGCRSPLDELPSPHDDSSMMTAMEVPTPMRNGRRCRGVRSDESRTPPVCPISESRCWLAVHVR